METLLKHFEAEAAKGLPPSPAELLAWGRKRKLAGLPSLAELSGVRQLFPQTAAFTSFKKQKSHMGPSFIRYGSIQVDYAEYGNDARTRWHNGGMGGFIIGVENFSRKMAVYPTKSKSSEAWAAALQTMLETVFDGISVIQADRDSALTGATFLNYMSKRFGVRFHFLKIRAKSYLAER
jgi:hypothetical protein